MSVTTQTLDLLEEYRAGVTAITDTQTRTLVRAWANGWNTVADELTDAIDDLTSGDTPPTRAKIIRSRKLAAALDTIADQLDTLVREAGVSVVGQLPTAMQLAGQANTALLASMLPPLTGAALVVGWDRVDPRALAAIITRTTQQIHASSIPLSAEAVGTMKTNLVRGLAAGDNPRRTAARMLRETEGTFNGGLVRTLRIARTETLDAMREAARLSDRANQSVVEGWVWTATLTTRTCAACWAMHGQEFPQTQPGPEGHQNCRCARVPKVKSWAELGFVGIEEPPSILPDARATFEGLDPSEQVAILGPGRFAAWQEGRYPMDSWAAKRSTEGWRDSWVVSPVPPPA